MEQTSVEWLEEELKDKLGTIVINKNWELMESLFKQAKSMEKEQIIRVYLMSRCYDSKNSVNDAEQYYYETFKS